MRQAKITTQMLLTTRGPLLAVRLSVPWVKVVLAVRLHLEEALVTWLQVSLSAPARLMFLVQVLPRLCHTT